MRPPHPSKNPACEVNRTGLKRFKGRMSDPVDTELSNLCDTSMGPPPPHSLGGGKGAQASGLWPLPPIAFPFEGGSPSLLAAKHLLDVGSLSGRAHASRIRLITNRHWLFPASCPASPWAFLAVGWPGTMEDGNRNDSGLQGGERRSGSAGAGTIPAAPTRKTGCGEERSGKSISRQRYGVSTFRFRSACGSRCLLSTGWRSNREGLPFTAPSGHLNHFGSSLSASLACSRLTVGHRRFTSVHPARSLALTRIEAPWRALLSRDFEPRAANPRFGTLSGPLFIQALRFTRRYGWSPHSGGHLSEATSCRTTGLLFSGGVGRPLQQPGVRPAWA